MEQYLEGPQQCFCGMQRTPARRMFDLLPARDAGRDDDRVRIVLHSREKPPPSDGNRDVVMLLFISEGAGHAAATGIDLFNGISQPQGFFQISGTDESLLVAMSVNQCFRLLTIEL